MFGIGSIDRLADEVVAFALQRILVIAGPASAATAERVIADLGDRCVGTFRDIRQHVPQQTVVAAVAAATDADADGVVTIGGGSATGLGKAVAVELDLPIVAVPTTYSGSEMTPIYGITGERKRTARDPRALPRAVVYDPGLTVSLPPELTASSGFNALAHAVEALYAPATSPVVTLLAEEALRVLTRSLPAATQSGDDLVARSEALYGAYLAGASLAWSGTALHHKLCHVLGGRHRLSHAGTHAVLLPHVAAYNRPAAPAALAAVAATLGADDAAAGLLALAHRLGVPTSLEDLGMPADALDDAAAEAVASVGTTNPRPVDTSSLRALLDDAYAGRPPREWK